MVDESKINSESKSRNSKRGTISNQNKIKLDVSSKTKSPAINNPRVDEFGPSLKEREATTDLAINKSIYLRTANFLIKNNAFAVIKIKIILNLFYFNKKIKVGRKIYG